MSIRNITGILFLEIAATTGFQELYPKLKNASNIAILLTVFTLGISQYYVGISIPLKRNFSTVPLTIARD